MTLADGFHNVAPGTLPMVVTYLEMTSPAPLRDVPCPAGLAFQTWTPDVESYREVFRGVGSPWLWFGRLRMTDAQLTSVLSDENIHLWTLIKDGRPEAILELDFRQDGECELAYFGLTSVLIGSGAGAYLMDQAISNAWAQPINRFHLHTCTLDSPQALGFYIRSGFTPYKREVEIDNDPRVLGIYDRSVAPQIPII